MLTLILMYSQISFSSTIAGGMSDSWLLAACLPAGKFFSCFRWHFCCSAQNEFHVALPPSPTGYFQLEVPDDYIVASCQAHHWVNLAVLPILLTWDDGIETVVTGAQLLELSGPLFADDAPEAEPR
jgi:hypothetical protein